jgi:hypothetical protein
MNYWNRISLLLLLSLLNLSTDFLIAPITIAQNKSPIRREQEVYVNAADLCKKNPSSSLRGDKTGLAVMASQCSRLASAVITALRDAKYSPKGYNLRNKHDFDKFIEGSILIVTQNKEVKSAYSSVYLFFPESVLEKILQGSVGAYLWLDYDIDPRKL